MNIRSNKSRNIYLVVALITVAFMSNTSCRKKDEFNCNIHHVSDCSETVGKTNIRIKNISNYEYCNFKLDPFSQLVNCGAIKKNEATCYYAFDTAYSYAYVSFFIGDKEFFIQPIDYVGETPVNPGKYTYLIDVTDFKAGLVSIQIQND